MPNHVMNDELRQLVQNVCRQFMNSFQPRPKALRRQRRQSSTSSPSQPIDNVRAVATTTCSAASGNVTPGTGFATLYVQPASGAIGGTAWTPGATNVLYENWEPRTIAIGTKIVLRKSRTNPVTGGDLYEVIETDGAVASEDIRGFAYGTIPAATGIKDAATTPGVGQAKLHTMPTSGNAGTAWAVNTTPVIVENWMRGSIVSYKPLLLRPSRKAINGAQIYTVVSEGCAEIPSS